MGFWTTARATRTKLMPYDRVACGAHVHPIGCSSHQDLSHHVLKVWHSLETSAAVSPGMCIVKYPLDQHSSSMIFPFPRHGKTPTYATRPRTTHRAVGADVLLERPEPQTNPCLTHQKRTEERTDCSTPEQTEDHNKKFLRLDKLLRVISWESSACRLNRRQPWRVVTFSSTLHGCNLAEMHRESNHKEQTKHQPC